jgi:hypothetical protein
VARLRATRGSRSCLSRAQVGLTDPTAWHHREHRAAALIPVCFLAYVLWKTQVRQLPSGRTWG